MSERDEARERLEANFHDELKSFLSKRDQGRVMGMYRRAVAALLAAHNAGAQTASERTAHRKWAVGETYWTGAEYRTHIMDENGESIAGVNRENAGIIVDAHNAGAQEPIATLHDDGYFTWKPGMRPQNVCQAGWRMDVFAAQPQLMTDAARDAKTCADATQIATVVKDLIELLVLWNSQASAGLDIAGLVGLRDELTEIERGEREGSKS